MPQTNENLVSQLSGEQVEKISNALIMENVDAMKTNAEQLEKLQEAVEASHEATDAALGTGPAPYLRWPVRTRPIVRDMRKVGRNEPCPCGSGLKYKNCCLASGKFETTHEE